MVEGGEGEGVEVEVDCDVSKGSWQGKGARDEMSARVLGGWRGSVLTRLLVYEGREALWVQGHDDAELVLLPADPKVAADVVALVAKLEQHGELALERRDGGGALVRFCAAEVVARQRERLDSDLGGEGQVHACMHACVRACTLHVGRVLAWGGVLAHAVGHFSPACPGVFPSRSAQRTSP